MQSVVNRAQVLLISFSPIAFLARSSYARRFFHHLLRYRRFEKAFLLAKDIGASDLFLDIYFEAKGLGDNQLARLAKQKADEITAAESSDSGKCSSATLVVSWFCGCWFDQIRCLLWKKHNGVRQWCRDRNRSACAKAVGGPLPRFLFASIM